MVSDPLLEEIWRIKDEHARKYNYDLRAMAEALMRAQEQHQAKLVSLSRETVAEAERVAEPSAKRPS